MKQQTAVSRPQVARRRRVVGRRPSKLWRLLSKVAEMMPGPIGRRAKVTKRLEKLRALRRFDAGGWRHALSTPIPQRVHLVGHWRHAHVRHRAHPAVRGHAVSGSDLRASPLTETLQALGARVVIGPHEAANVGDAELVVTTSAAIGDNPELEEARSRGIPADQARRDGRPAHGGQDGRRRRRLPRQEHDQRPGRLILAAAGRDPTYLIGAEVPGLGTNAAAGDGEHVVVEADEYDRAFLSYHLEVALVTNVEADHLDYYETWEAVQEAFRGSLAGEARRHRSSSAPTTPRPSSLREHAQPASRSLPTPSMRRQTGAQAG